jgi:hypothetical protein
MDDREKITQKVLTLMAGIDRPPFDSASVYLLDVKRLYNQMDADEQEKLKSFLASLQQTSDEEIMSFYATLKRQRLEKTQRWLAGLPGTTPTELTAALNAPPSEERCRRELRELAAECLKLIG